MVHAGHDVSDTYVQQIGLRNTRWIPRYVFHAQGSEWIFLDSFWSLGLILESSNEQSGNVHPKSKHWCNQQNNWPKIFKINVFRNSKKRIFLRYFSHKSDSKTTSIPQKWTTVRGISWRYLLGDKYLLMRLEGWKLNAHPGGMLSILCTFCDQWSSGLGPILLMHIYTGRSQL